MADKQDYDASLLGDQNTFQGKARAGRDDREARSLGDQATFAGGRPASDPQSLGDQMTFGGNDGAASPDDDGMEIVDLAARYTNEKVLGKGGMGEVLLATDKRLDRKVAIKRILGDAARSKTAVSRFLTEAKSIAALNHPNIVQIYDYGRAKDGPFLIMEYVDGNSLLDRCRQGAVPVEQAVSLVCQLCDGLGRAHDLGIIHRDIKPANVLLTQDGIPKLTDFGLAKAESADTGMTMTGAVLGTLEFMPPEQRRDAALTDARSDLWSLAATLYQLVTGETPRVIDLEAVPQQLRPVLSQALKTQKEQRYQSAKEFRDALKAALAGAGEVPLEEGSCPRCGTTNPFDRNFCRNEACGANLQVACLSCSHKIPMWEKVCNNCGAKQEDLLKERRSKMSTQQSEAESRLKEYNFEGAVTLAVALRDEPDLRLRHLQGWAEKFLPTVDQGRQQQLDRIGTLLGEARQHAKAHDYAAGIHALEQVPVILRGMKVPQQTQTAGELLSDLQAKQTQIRQLEALIRQRVAGQQLNGLPKEVDELLKLRPDRKDLQKLKQQLMEREARLIATRDEAVSSAQSLLENQDYEGAFQALAQVNPQVETDEVRRLRFTATSRRDRLAQLQRSIEDSVFDKKLHGLLEPVREFLQLKSNDATMITLRDRLIKRDKRNASEVSSVVENARGLRAECQFEAAVNLLEKIPGELRTQETDQLLVNCSTLSRQRSKALAALRNAMEAGDYHSGLDTAMSYAASLKRELLTDTEFDQEDAECREAEQAAVFLQASLKRLRSGAGILVLMGPVVAGVLWVQATLKSRALAVAVQGQQWDEVLKIDERHLPALVGRANQRLLSVPPDVDGALADIGLAEQVGPTNAAIQPAKGLAYVKRAAALATAGKIADAEKDLQAAETLGARSSDLTAGRQVLGAAYLKRAAALATAGKIADAEKDLQVAETLGARSSDLTAGRQVLGAAYVKRAAALATAGKIADAEKELKHAETLGVHSSDLTAGRQVLAAGYVKLAETAVIQRDVVGIRAACDSAERYAAASHDLQRLRAAAFHAEGEQREKSGDLSGAMNALEEAVKLDRSLGLKTERAVLHVKLAEQATAKQDYQTAATALEAAVSLDKAASGVRELALTFAEQVIVLFESDASAANQLAAMDAVKTIESVDPGNSQLTALRGRVVATVIKRAEASVATDLDTSLSCYEQALSLGASVADVAKLKGVMVTLVRSRFEKSLAEQDAGKRAAADYEALVRLDSQMAGGFIAEVAKLPTRKNSIGMTFRLLPGGVFTMSEGKEAHKVTLTKPFEIGVYEVTQKQYQRVMGPKPSAFPGPQNPVEQVSWDDAVEFCRKLSAMPEEKAAGYVYRLPTEAEWEYACRAGTDTKYSFGDDESQLGDYAWYDRNSEKKTHPVGQKKPNPWGLYDMHGNVWEWCQDWEGNYPSGAAVDPTGPPSASSRVLRGGSLGNGTVYCRTADRNGTLPGVRGNNFGLRVVRSSER
jgi:formylglycine-generating enzyme required for sulfatase activity/serine/threonine protein kinase